MSYQTYKCVALLLLLLEGLASARSTTAQDATETHFTLEECTNLTLTSTEYKLTESGQLILATDDTILTNRSSYQISEDGTVHLCYPTSPELRKCHRKIPILPDEYKIKADNKALHHLRTDDDDDYGLGNYLVKSNGVAIVCHKDKRQRKRRRTCNFILLSPGEYNIDGDNNLWLVASHERLPVRNYTLDAVSNVVNACYPLSKQFLGCGSFWVLLSHEVEILPNKMLLSKAHGELFDRGDYFLIEGNKAVTCSKHASPSTHYLVRMQTVTHIISAIFLAAAIVVHLLLPGLSYQRAPLLCQAFSLFATYVCLATRLLVLPLSESNCYLLFYFTYYFTMAAFCWLSILGFDLWRISVSLRKGTEAYRWVTDFCNGKFLLYCAVGWGVPLLFALMVGTVDYLEHIQNTLGLYPQIAAMCWFSERPSAFTFFYGPLCAILAINFGFFGFTVRNLRLANRHAEFANVKLNRQLLVICFVIFLAMGLFWTTEVITFTTLAQSWWWTITDLINGLQGVVIAAVYTCKPQTWQLLKRKCACHINRKR